MNLEYLVSNEIDYNNVIPQVLDIVPKNGVYIGVGPDQNYTYIASSRPKLSFIVDGATADLAGVVPRALPHQYLERPF